MERKHKKKILAPVLTNGTLSPKHKKNKHDSLFYLRNKVD